MTLVPDDFVVAQIVHVPGSGELLAYGQLRFPAANVRSATKRVVVPLTSLTKQEREQLDAERDKLISQAAEEGFVVDRIMFNPSLPVDEPGRLRIEGHHELPDGARSGTRVKDYRLNPPTQEEIIGVLGETAGLDESERTSHLSLEDKLRQLARAEEGFTEETIPHGQL